MSKELKPHIVRVMTTEFADIYMQATDAVQARILAEEYWQEHKKNRPDVAKHSVIGSHLFFENIVH